MKKSNQQKLDRRKFLNVAGLAAASEVFSSATLLPSKISFDPIPDLPLVPVNRNADILGTKIICIEPGKFFGQGTEYVLNINGHVVVRKKVLEPNRYLGWPTIVKTNDNRLLVAFSGDRDAHVCPFGKTQLIVSSDNGKSWSEPETITNTALDDRDAGIIQTQKGTLLVSWFTSVAFERPSFEAAYNRYARIGEKIAARTRKKWMGNWVRRSADGGKTWQRPVRTAASAPHGPIQLRDGRLLYIGRGEWKGEPACIVEQSADDGLTWEVITEIPEVEKGIPLNEPHLVELKSGKLLAMFRNEPKDPDKCYLLQSESADGGKTWSPVHSTGIWGYPPHLIQLRNGWVLVVYGYRRQPFGEKACISRDEGRTWDTENDITLTGAASRDLGYPSSVQLDDDSILTVYYQASKMGEPACLMSTHWRLK